jgi:hypothetical protein
MDKMIDDRKAFLFFLSNNMVNDPPGGPSELVAKLWDGSKLTRRQYVRKRRPNYVFDKGCCLASRLENMANRLLGAGKSVVTEACSFLPSGAKMCWKFIWKIEK